MAKDAGGCLKMTKIKPQDKALRFTGSDVEQFLDDYEPAAELNGTSDYDKARQIGFFMEAIKTRTILANLEGYKPLDWVKLRAAMLSYWVDVDKALYTERDVASLVDSWTQKGGVSSVKHSSSLSKLGR
jgi:hypothetical protein